MAKKVLSALQTTLQGGNFPEDLKREILSLLQEKEELTYKVKFLRKRRKELREEVAYLSESRKKARKEVKAISEYADMFESMYFRVLDENKELVKRLAPPAPPTAPEKPLGTIYTVDRWGNVEFPEEA